MWVSIDLLINLDHAEFNNNIIGFVHDKIIFFKNTGIVSSFLDTTQSYIAHANTN